NFSIGFYEKLLPGAVTKKGVLRIPNENFKLEKLKDNALKYDYLDTQKLQNISKNFKNIEGYFYENAAIAEPLPICKKLLEGCDIYIKDIKKLDYNNGLYEIGEIKTKNIILAQGASNPLVNLPYMKILPVFGLRIDVKTTTRIPFNIHKSISISANKHDGTVAIGATHEKHDVSQFECSTTCDKCIFYIDTEEEQTRKLLSQAEELINLENTEVVKTYKGARATIKSFFPAIGKIINFESSVKKYPSIKKGARVSPDLLEYYPNLYIINALGSRGFVFGPYLAKLLSENIMHETPIPDEISIQRLFYKMAREKQNQM
ncbi:MAG: tRNA 5-methylaminomethyl-2-thiouridine biosynthesis bifunctional protein, partial [Campylobacterota bacterium]|nr:tRNA 5-methylaminomethyl-2-thiouridine biosynthesis bifunctional protein [Campylobacterota bacterium]